MHAAEYVAVIQTDQRDALRRATHHANLGDSGAYQRAALGNQHDLIVFLDQLRGDDFAVALGGLDGDHAFGAAPVAGVFGDRGAFAKAVFGGGQDKLFFVFSDQQRDDALAFVEVHAAHTARAATHWAHVVFVKAHGFARVGEQHDVVLTIGDRCANQVVAFVQRDGDDAGFTRIGEIGQRGFLDRAHAGGHEDVLIFGEPFACIDRQHDGDFFAFFEWQHANDRRAARGA